MALSSNTDRSFTTTSTITSSSPPPLLPSTTQRAEEHDDDEMLVIFANHYKKELLLLEAIVEFAHYWRDGGVGVWRCRSHWTNELRSACPTFDQLPKPEQKRLIEFLITQKVLEVRPTVESSQPCSSRNSHRSQEIAFRGLLRPFSPTIKSNSELLQVCERKEPKQERRSDDDDDDDDDSPLHQRQRTGSRLLGPFPDRRGGPQDRTIYRRAHDDQKEANDDDVRIVTELAQTDLEAAIIHFARISCPPLEGGKWCNRGEFVRCLLQHKGFLSSSILHSSGKAERKKFLDNLFSHDKGIFETRTNETTMKTQTQRNKSVSPPPLRRQAEQEIRLLPLRLPDSGDRVHDDPSRMGGIAADDDDQEQTNKKGHEAFSRVQQAPQLQSRRTASSCPESGESASEPACAVAASKSERLMVCCDTSFDPPSNEKMSRNNAIPSRDSCRRSSRREAKPAAAAAATHDAVDPSSGGGESSTTTDIPTIEKLSIDVMKFTRNYHQEKQERGGGNWMHKGDWTTALRRQLFSFPPPFPQREANATSNREAEEEAHQQQQQQLLLLNATIRDLARRGLLRIRGGNSGAGGGDEEIMAVPEGEVVELVYGWNKSEAFAHEDAVAARSANNDEEECLMRTVIEFATTYEAEMREKNDKDDATSLRSNCSWSSTRSWKAALVRRNKSIAFLSKTKRDQLIQKMITRGMLEERRRDGDRDSGLSMIRVSPPAKTTGTALSKVMN